MTSKSHVIFNRVNLCQNGSISFEFKTSQPNGILLYMDDGGLTDYLLVSLVGSRARLRLNYVTPGQESASTYIGKDLSNNQWHSVSILRRGPETILRLDGVAAIVRQTGEGNDDILLGNHTNNSPIYLFGIPTHLSTPFYSTSMTKLSLPDALSEPSINGEIRNYRTSECGCPSIVHNRPSGGENYRLNTKCELNADSICKDHCSCIDTLSDQSPTQYKCDCDIKICKKVDATIERLVVPFDAIIDKRIPASPQLRVIVSQDAKIQTGVIGNALYLPGVSSFVRISPGVSGKASPTCFWRLSTCTNGFTLSMYVFIRGNLPEDRETSLLEPSPANGAGLRIIADRGGNNLRVTYTDVDGKQWFTEGRLRRRVLQHIAITWDPTGGELESVANDNSNSMKSLGALTLAINGELRQVSRQPTGSIQTPKHNQDLIEYYTVQPSVSSILDELMFENRYQDTATLQKISRGFRTYTIRFPVDSHPVVGFQINVVGRTIHVSNKGMMATLFRPLKFENLQIESNHKDKECFFSLQKCPQGFTMSWWMRVDEPTVPRNIIQSRDISVRLENEKLVFTLINQTTVSTANRYHITLSRGVVRPKVWQLWEFSISPEHGLNVYCDLDLFARNDKPKRIQRKMAQGQPFMFNYNPKGFHLSSGTLLPPGLRDGESDDDYELHAYSEDYSSEIDENFSEKDVGNMYLGDIIFSYADKTRLSAFGAAPYPCRSYLWSDLIALKAPDYATTSDWSAKWPTQYRNGGKTNRAFHINKKTGPVMIDSSYDVHITRLTDSPRGFYLSFWLMLDNIDRRTVVLQSPNILISHGGSNDAALEVQVQDADNLYHGKIFNVDLGKWYFIEIEWRPSDINGGLRCYKNKGLMVEHKRAIQVKTSLDSKYFIIGDDFNLQSVFPPFQSGSQKLYADDASNPEIFVDDLNIYLTDRDTLIKYGEIQGSEVASITVKREADDPYLKVDPTKKETNMENFITVPIGDLLQQGLTGVYGFTLQFGLRFHRDAFIGNKLRPKSVIMHGDGLIVHTDEDGSAIVVDYKSRKKKNQWITSTDRSRFNIQPDTWYSFDITWDPRRVKNALQILINNEHLVSRESIKKVAEVPENIPNSEFLYLGRSPDFQRQDLSHSIPFDAYMLTLIQSCRQNLMDFGMLTPNLHVPADAKSVKNKPDRLIQFDGKQYICYEYPSPYVPPTSVANAHERIELDFRTSSPDSLLLYASDGSRHTRIYTEDGYLFAVFKPPHSTKPITLHLSRPLNDNRWHSLVIDRTGNVVRMYVDNEQDTAAVTHQFPSDMSLLNGAIVYVGQVPQLGKHKYITPFPNIDGFRGQLKHVNLVIDQYKENIVDDVYDGNLAVHRVPDPEPVIQKPRPNPEPYYPPVPYPPTDREYYDSDLPMSFPQRNMYVYVDLDARHSTPENICIKFITKNPSSPIFGLFKEGQIDAPNHNLFAFLRNGQPNLLITHSGMKQRLKLNDRADDNRKHEICVELNQFSVSLILDGNQRTSGSLSGHGGYNRVYLGFKHPVLATDHELSTVSDRFTGCLYDFRINQEQVVQVKDVKSGMRQCKMTYSPQPQITVAVKPPPIQPPPGQFRPSTWKTDEWFKIKQNWRPETSPKIDFASVEFAFKTFAPKSAILSVIDPETQSVPLAFYIDSGTLHALNIHRGNKEIIRLLHNVNDGQIIYVRTEYDGQRNCFVINSEKSGETVRTHIMPNHIHTRQFLNLKIFMGGFDDFTARHVSSPLFDGCLSNIYWTSRPLLSCSQLESYYCVYNGAKSCQPERQAPPPTLPPSPTPPPEEFNPSRPIYFDSSVKPLDIRPATGDFRKICVDFHVKSAKDMTHQILLSAFDAEGKARLVVKLDNQLLRVSVQGTEQKRLPDESPRSWYASDTIDVSYPVAHRLCVQKYQASNSDAHRLSIIVDDVTRQLNLQPSGIREPIWPIDSIVLGGFLTPQQEQVVQQITRTFSTDGDSRADLFEGCMWNVVAETSRGRRLLLHNGPISVQRFNQCPTSLGHVCEPGAAEAGAYCRSGNLEGGRCFESWQDDNSVEKWCDCSIDYWVPTKDKSKKCNEYANKIITDTNRRNPTQIYVNDRPRDIDVLTFWFESEDREADLLTLKGSDGEKLNLKLIGGRLNMESSASNNGHGSSNANTMLGYGLDDGRRHTVVIVRRGPIFRISIDDRKFSADKEFEDVSRRPVPLKQFKPMNFKEITIPADAHSGILQNVQLNGKLINVKSTGSCNVLNEENDEFCHTFVSDGYSYGRYALPNHWGKHRPTAIFQDDIQTYETLLKDRQCGPSLASFLCPLNYPICNEGKRTSSDSQILLPCYRQCWMAHRHCTRKMVNNQWPYHLQCQHYKQPKCIDESGRVISQDVFEPYPPPLPDPPIVTKKPVTVIKRIEGKCSPMNELPPSCTKYYVNARYPNWHGDRGHDQALQRFSQKLGMLNHACKWATNIFFCPSFFPPCYLSDRYVLPPCQSYCKTVKDRCSYDLLNYGIDWPQELDCRRFPDEPGYCFDEKMMNQPPPTPVVDDGCERLTRVGMCREGLSYSRTRFPNRFGHRTQEEADREAQMLQSIVNSQCHRYAKLFLCLHYAPTCTKQQETWVKPCRTLCQEFHESCASAMSRIDMPRTFPCDQYPIAGGNESCISYLGKKVEPQVTPAPPNTPPTRVRPDKVPSDAAIWRLTGCKSTINFKPVNVPVTSDQTDLSFIFRPDSRDGIIFYSGNHNKLMRFDLENGLPVLTVSSNNVEKKLRPTPDQARQLQNDRNWRKYYTVRIANTKDRIHLIYDDMNIGKEPLKIDNEDDRVETVAAVNGIKFGSDENNEEFTKMELHDVMYTDGNNNYRMDDYASSSSPAVKYSGYVEYKPTSVEEMDRDSPQPIKFRSDNSYVKVDPPSARYGGRNNDKSLKFQFKTDMNNDRASSTLLSTSRTNDKDRVFAIVFDEYARLVALQKYEEDGQSKTTKNIINRRPLNDGQWHQLQLDMVEDDLHIQVDNEKAELKMKENVPLFSDDSSLIIGYDDESITSSMATLPKRSFLGCVDEITVGNSDPISYCIMPGHRTIKLNDVHGGCYDVNERKIIEPPPMVTAPPPKFPNVIIKGKEITLDPIMEGGEVYFTGDGFINFQQEIAKSPNWEKVELNFRTDQPNMPLFYTGRPGASICLSLKNGLVYSTSHQYPNSDRAEESIGRHANASDDRWHKLEIERNEQNYRIILDGKETNKFRSTLPLITNIDQRGDVSTRIGVACGTVGYKGKMKDLYYVCCDDSSPKTDILQRLDNSAGDVNAHGTIVYMPQSPRPIDYNVEHTQPIQFTDKSALLAVNLPKQSKGNDYKLSMMFKTRERQGLLFYWGAGGSTNFWAMELYNGIPYAIVEMGEGIRRVKGSNSAVSDSRWHYVEFERKGKDFWIRVDNRVAKFLVPANVEMRDPHLHIGNSKSARKLPWQLWTSNGFAGCLKNVWLHTHYSDLARIDALRKAQSITVGCTEPTLQCSRTLECKHNGVCRDGWPNSYCECMETQHTGDTCEKMANILSLNGSTGWKEQCKDIKRLSHEDVWLQFKTLAPSGVLFALKSEPKSPGMAVGLENGKIAVTYAENNGIEEKRIVSKYGTYNDNNWHRLHLLRLGTVLQVVVDGNKVIVDHLHDHPTYVDYSIINVGYAGELNKNNGQSPDYLNRGLIGYIQNVYFNGEELMGSRKRFKTPGCWTDITAYEGLQEPLLHNVITFTTQQSNARWLDRTSPYVADKHKTVLHSFHFRTDNPNGVILYRPGVEPDTHMGMELVQGKFHVLLKPPGISNTITLHSTGENLADGKWHSVHLVHEFASSVSEQPHSSKLILTVDGRPTSHQIPSPHKPFRYSETVYIGAIPPNVQKPTEMSAPNGFQGCFASFMVNGLPINLFFDSYKLSADVINGCIDDRSKLCGADKCYHGGTCIQYSDNFKCECQMTSYTGFKCADYSTAYYFGKSLSPGLINYAIQPTCQNSNNDKMAFGVVTKDPDAILARVEGRIPEHIEIKMRNGRPSVMWNFGQSTGTLTSNEILNDGVYHILRLWRIDDHLRFQVDDGQFYEKKMLTDPNVFDCVTRILVGGKYDENHKIVDDLNGIVSGLYYNGHYVLDKALAGDPNVELIGDVVPVAPGPNGFVLEEPPKPAINETHVKVTAPPVSFARKDPVPPKVIDYPRRAKGAAVLGGILAGIIGTLLGLIALVLAAARYAEKPCFGAAAKGYAVAGKPVETVGVQAETELRVARSADAAGAGAGARADVSVKVDGAALAKGNARSDITIINNYAMTNQGMKHLGTLALNGGEVTSVVPPPAIMSGTTFDRTAHSSTEQRQTAVNIPIVTHPPTVDRRQGTYYLSQMDQRHQGQGLSQQKQKAVYEYQAADASCVALSADGHQAAVGLHNGSPQIWNTVDGMFIQALDAVSINQQRDGSVPPSKNSLCLRLACNDSTLVGLANDETFGGTVPSSTNASPNNHSLLMWDFRHARQIHLSHQIKCCTFCLVSDTNSVVMAGNQKFGRGISIGIFDLKHSALTKEIKSDPNISFGASPSWVQLTPDDSRAIVGCYNPATQQTNFVLFNLLATGEIQSCTSLLLDTVAPSPAACGCTGSIDASGPAGTTTLVTTNNEVLTGTRNGGIVVWSAINGEILNTYHQLHNAAILAMALSSNEAYFVTASADATAKVIQTQNNKEVSTLLGHQGEVTCASFSANSDMVITGSRDSTIRMWKTYDGQPVSAITVVGTPVECRMAPHNKTIVAISEKEDRTRQLLMLRVVGDNPNQ
ncbi:hypothetical protein SNEBB_004378 [Seison nebaliae]|nr:hypothetical protein SNEBB_004378 [Seison nebaliae]